ncbi:zinc finger protein 585B-like [Homalodisca vitripennis]|uniref:zinc finger protein 585B-like n=1 Tax=Homalodisca vitripennis TaxID=197043 RepID=UPI001EEA536B|nr:zinc finger protein 585B-like [Homalodisca vitripennis]
MEEDNVDDNNYNEISRKSAKYCELEDDDELMSDYDSDEEYSTLYSCSICNASGMVIGDFLKHTREHTRDERQQVLERMTEDRLAQKMAAREAAVAYGFKRQSSLKSSVTLYLCVVCGQGNLLLRNLKEHSSLHPECVRSHYCNLCQQQFQNEKELSDHLEMHLDNNDLICQYCNRKFSIIEDLESHESGHHQAEYKCTYCRESFKSKEFVLSHLRKIHSTQSVCHICDKDFKTENLLYKHFITHASLCIVKKLVQYFTCDFCAKKYDSKISLQRHTLFLHNDRMPYICEHCGFTAYHEEPLREHLVKEHVHNSMYLCCKCGLEFRNKSELDAHMTTHSDRTNRCNMCSLKFEHFLDLKYHMTSHSDVGPVTDAKESDVYENSEVLETSEKDFIFICNRCDETFEEEEMYATHMNGHVPTVSCDLCEKLFESDVLLNIHLNKVHTNKFGKPDLKKGALPFKCDICSASFRLEFELEDHCIIHRDVLYQCHVCFEEFLLDKELQDHLGTHDEESNENLESTVTYSESKPLLNNTGS